MKTVKRLTTLVLLGLAVLGGTVALSSPAQACPPCSGPMDPPPPPPPSGD